MHQVQEYTVNVKYTLYGIREICFGPVDILFVDGGSVHNVMCDCFVCFIVSAADAQ